MSRTWLDQARLTYPLHLVNMPQRFRAADSTELPQAGLCSIVGEYIEQFWDLAPQGIAPLLLGPARTWKTHAAAAIANKVFLAGRVPVEWVNVPDQFLTLDLNRYTDESRRMIARWKRVPFLVMDDFGVIEKGSFGATVLAAVASARFDSQRPTLWTGNVHTPSSAQLFKTLAQVYSPLFARRLEDGSRGFVGLTG